MRFSTFFEGRGAAARTHIFGDELAIHLRAWGDSRRGLGRGGINTQALFYDSKQVGETGDSFHIDLLFVLERFANLIRQITVHRAVSLHAEVEEQCRQRRRRSFAPGIDQQRRIHDDLHIGEARRAVAVLLQHVRHEIPPAAGGLPLTLPGHGLLGRHALVLLVRGDVPGRHERPEPLVMLQHAVERDAARGGDDAQDPGVVVAALERVERVREHEVADDVEGDEVEPVHEVEHLSRHGALTQPRDQHVDVVLDHGLLLVHARVREGVGELPPEAAVHVVRPADERQLVVVVVEAPLLLPLGLAQAVLEDLREGDGAVDREVVRCDADDGAVLLVQGEILECQGARDASFPKEGEIGRGVELGPGVFGQWVEEDAVDRDSKPPQNGLCLSLVISFILFTSFRSS